MSVCRYGNTYLVRKSNSRKWGIIDRQLEAEAQSAGALVNQKLPQSQVGAEVYRERAHKTTASVKHGRRNASSESGACLKLMLCTFSISSIPGLRRFPR